MYLIPTMSYQTFTSKSEKKDTNLAFDEETLDFFSLLMGKPITVSDMAQVEKKKQSIKEKMPSWCSPMLTKYSESGDDKILSGTTFRYIANYKKTGEVAGRLSVALADFGYTRDEIDKVSLDEIIQEIIYR